MRFYGKKVAIIISLPNESVQAWLECKLIMIFISDNLIVVLQFGSALQSTVMSVKESIVAMIIMIEVYQ